MTEIVINRCYGGFGLSPRALEAYLALKGKQVYFYTHTKLRYREGVDEYTRNTDPGRRDFVYAVPCDLGETTDSITDHFDVDDIPRDDPDLVRIVRELGKAARSSCAHLEIVEVPDDAEWTIEEYDGLEWVAEKHRAWF